MTKRKPPVYPEWSGSGHVTRLGNKYYIIGSYIKKPGFYQQAIYQCDKWTKAGRTNRKVIFIAEPTETKREKEPIITKLKEDLEFYVMTEYL